MGANRKPITSLHIFPSGESVHRLLQHSDSFAKNITCFINEESFHYPESLQKISEDVPVNVLYFLKLFRKAFQKGGHFVVTTPLPKGEGF